MAEVVAVVYSHLEVAQLEEAKYYAIFRRIEERARYSGATRVTFWLLRRTSAKVFFLCFGPTNIFSVDSIRFMKPLCLLWVSLHPTYIQVSKKLSFIVQNRHVKNQMT